MLVNATLVSANNSGFPRGQSDPLRRPLSLNHAAPQRGHTLLRHNKDVEPQESHASCNKMASTPADHRLRKHADYQRVYREGRKRFSPSISYFYALRTADSPVPNGPRVGLTAGKVLGNAVERNRIKRRMRDIIRRRVSIVAANVDIVLHPRKSVLTIEFAKLEGEVSRIFTNIQAAMQKAGNANQFATTEQSAPQSNKSRVAS